MTNVFDVGPDHPVFYFLLMLGEASPLEVLGIAGELACKVYDMNPFVFQELSKKFKKEILLREVGNVNDLGGEETEPE